MPANERSAGVVTPDASTKIAPAPPGNRNQANYIAAPGVTPHLGGQPVYSLRTPAEAVTSSAVTP